MITCEQIAKEEIRFHYRRIAPLVSQGFVLFLDRFSTILEAYRSGAMKYGYFVAKKPEA